MHLQGADTRRQLDDALEIGGLEPLHERMHTQPQLQIEHQIAIFDEKIFVTRASINDGGRRVPSRQTRHDRRIDRRSVRGVHDARDARDGDSRRRRLQRIDQRLLSLLGPQRLGRRHASEAHAIIRAQLAELPQFGLDDGRRADETAQ